MTDSSEEDKGKPEDLEEVKGRLYPPTEAPELTSLKLQDLPVTSSQGITGTSALESDISLAEALTPPYAASATHQQDEEGRHTLTPPDAPSVKQHKDEEGWNQTKFYTDLTRRSTYSVNFKRTSS